MYKNILIGLLTIVTLMTLGSKSTTILPPIITVKVDTFTTYKDTTIYKKGKTIYKDTTVYIPIPTNIKIDTNAILKDFYAKNVYNDTLILPEGYVSINDTIFQNNILGRTFLAKITQKTITITKEIKTQTPKPRPSLYWGLMGLQDKDGTLGFGGGLIYKSPYAGMIQLNITSSKQIQLGYYTKIF